MINKKLFGITISDMSYSEVLEYLLEKIEKGDKKVSVTTLNTEILVASMKKNDYQKIVEGSDLKLVDSVGVLVGGRIMGIPLKHRVPGVNLVEFLCKEVSIRPITVGFVGARDKIAEKASVCLKEKYPGLKIAFAISEWPNSEAKSKSLKCDILFVALGHPKQEIWISQNLSKINARVAIGVGGAFDFISGNVRRAPKWVQKVGFEWLFRLIIQPWRIKRQSALIYFVLVILTQKVKKIFGS